ncbi:hypothetical protein FY528_11970 [Hymenobacter lutimineralis]|uniref:Uncharacterized protein n=1 Tax=Hymenobacter lutimineralis TaxID=2606448 RepID=A0A5D6V0Z4_9BACT|nr:MULTISPECIES: hypothetical protein [Hymenobacter]QIX61372.1 hypothetical protein HER32_09355 [Hymenobacter sp. BT18]TYZ08925.1 hypothetical protein FY528_11970 [Hymenobacter lutimineralis]
MDSTTPTPQSVPAPTIPLEVTDKQNSALVEDTLALLNEGVPSQENQRGASEIARWKEVLLASERPGLAKIKQEIVLLQEQLAATDTEAHAIAETLASLGAETIKVAEEAANGYTAPLTHLGKLLIKLGSSLSR